ncbi:hypothetical protein OPKNFCMD_1429 [Methylobacterium crusticola]|uniref:Uncharacterized protein n=1 Tax=Methylobacterium crusticola TaxID=1697972 RepID=A0ABQ4QTQ5_9HYPH|nr:hypothetical protein [Methylobacterium crusticola]GJD48706.1 hypothetical protein OPKNFCMD_1429 [Methylobacterium crusticola]
MEPLRSTPVRMMLGERTIEGVVRAVGEVVSLPQAADAPPRRLRNLILDFGAACAPVELWLDEEASPHAAPLRGPARGAD